MSERNKGQRLFKKKSIILAAMAIAAGLIGFNLLRLTASKGNIGSRNDHPTFTVMRGPLRINVVESGTIKAREQLIIKNEVEGKTSIIYLVPEGTQVEKGQLLIELDASGLLDQKIDQQIKV